MRAKKKTQPFILRRITGVMQQAADHVAAEQRNADWQHRENLPSADSADAQVRRAEDQLDGIGFLAFKLGYRCECEPQPHTSTKRCDCLRLRKIPPLKQGGVLSGATRKRKKPGFFFDGVRCRDGQGSFVPVSQCKGPVGRDPDTGKYISIK